MAADESTPAPGPETRPGRRPVAVATVIIDRAVALWALIWFVALAGALFWALGLLAGTAQATLEGIVVAAAGIVAALLML